MRTIFASVDLSLWGGSLFHPVFGGDKPQMLVKRITSSVMSNDPQFGCVPSDGKSFFHWSSWSTLRLRLESVRLCWPSQVSNGCGEWDLLRRILNAAAPSLVTRLHNFSPFFFSVELANVDVGGLAMVTYVETLMFCFKGAQEELFIFTENMNNRNLSKILRKNIPFSALR